MPYTNLFDGSRVETQVASTAAAAAWANELQDQLKDILGPLTVNIPLIGAIPGTTPFDGAGTNLWDYYTGATNPPFWQCTGATTATAMYVPFPWIRSGWQITGLAAVTTSDEDDSAGSDEGSIELYRHKIDATGAATGAAIATIANAFNNPAPASWALVTAGALTLTIDATYNYWLKINAAYDAGPAVTSKLLGMYATLKLGS